MAPAALQGCMLPLKWITNLTVVKSFPTRLPMNDRKVFPQVFRVTSNTVLSPLTFIHHSRMKSFVPLDALQNFGMALDTFEFPGTTAKTMAGGAFVQPV